MYATFSHKNINYQFNNMIDAIAVIKKLNKKRVRNLFSIFKIRISS